MINKQILLLITIMTLILTACKGEPLSTQSPTEMPVAAVGSPYPSVLESAAYPYPQPGELVLDSSYPAPAALEIVATPGSIPNPGVESGVVTGYFLQDNQPVSNAILYLAEVVKSDDGKEILASINLTKSPRCYSDAEGLFVFSNLAPGKYAMVLETVIAEYLLRDPANPAEDLLFEVKVGETTDLGKLNFTDLPDMN